jgi:DNA-binding transcriptional MocR family regulator
LKMLTIVNSSGFCERIVDDLILSGQYRHHLARLRNRIDTARKNTLSVLNTLGMDVFGIPAGGYYIWAELPESVDDIELARYVDRRAILTP